MPTSVEGAVSVNGRGCVPSLLFAVWIGVECDGAALG